MALTLPEDLLELVVEDISLSSCEDRTQNLLSCCLVSKSFARPCQKALFSSVAFYLPRRRRSGNPNYERTLALAKTINSAPHLAVFVRKLTVLIVHSLLPWPTGDFQDEIALALSALHMVSELSLSAIPEKRPMMPKLPAPYGLSMPPQIQTAFAQLMRGPQLRQFTLKAIKRFPANLILEAYQLHTLELTRSEVTQTTPSEWIALGAQSLPIGYLRTLRCDRDAPSRDIGTLLLLSTAAGPHGLQFNRIDTLDVAIRSPTDKAANRAILEKAERLSYLHISMGPMYSSVPHDPPLCNLNRNSFDTLTVFHLRLEVVVNEEGPPAEMAIRDPYLGLCDTLLGQLHALQELKLVVVLYGRHKVPSESFGPQWGRLAEVLTTPNAYPELRTIKMFVEVRLDGLMYSRRPDEERYQKAIDVERTINTSVYGAQLRCLHELEVRGRMVEFSFKASVAHSPPPRDSD
ncbi:hypothetical protein NMY22_g11046 [Coprinellus aureogranulatus]|nr:hypothetical protein NMY22_g11046 [Coprinellus aureogranulatus]